MNENPRKFLFKMSNGSYVRIKAQKEGIAISKLYKDEKWSSPFILENLHPSFFAEIDSLDNLHILAQDFSGNIYYYKSDKSIFSKYPVLRSSDRSAFERNFFIFLNRDLPVFFYTVHKDNSSALIYQTFMNNKAGTPIPISTVPDTGCPYWISRGKNKTALILCPRVSGMYIQIYAAKLRLDNLSLSSFTKITNEETDCESPRCIALPDGTIHMLYSTHRNGKYYLKYEEINESGVEFSDSEIIASSGHPFRRYNLEYSGNKIYVNWIEDGYVNYREKTLSESEFSRAKLLKVPRMNRVEYFFYNSNLRQEKGNIFSTEQPMAIEDKVLHAFYRDEPFEVSKVVSNNLKEDKKVPLFQNDTLISTIASILLSQADINESRKNEAEKVVDFISVLSKAFANTETEQEESQEKK